MEGLVVVFSLSRIGADLLRLKKRLRFPTGAVLLELNSEEKEGVAEAFSLLIGLGGEELAMRERATRANFAADFIYLPGWAARDRKHFYA